MVLRILVSRRCRLHAAIPRPRMTIVTMTHPATGTNTLGRMIARSGSEESSSPEPVPEFPVRLTEKSGSKKSDDVNDEKVSTTCVMLGMDMPTGLATPSASARLRTRKKVVVTLD